MDVAGSSTITLAFSLTALEQLDDPAEVIRNSRRWSTNIGVVSDDSSFDVKNFAYDHNIKFDFTSGPRDLDVALEESRQMLVTDRHIFIGTGDSHENTAEEMNWEYLPIEEAAGAAEWELKGDQDNINYDGDLLEVEEQIQGEGHLEVQLNTLRWHQVNRAEKEWVVRVVDDKYNEDVVTEDRVVLLHRGVGEGHQIWAVIREVETFDSIDELVEEVPHSLIRPHAEEDEVVDRIRDSLGAVTDDDTYLAFRVETIDPEDNPELLDIEVEVT